MKTIRTKAFVILDGFLLSIDRLAADALYYSGKHKRNAMNVQVLTDLFGRLLWASPRPARVRPRPDRPTDPRDHQSANRSRAEMLGGQGVPRSGRTRPSPGGY